jgi:cytochrome c
MRLISSLICLGTLLIGPVLSVENATASKQDKAKALCEKAVAHIIKVGTQKAYTDFSDPKGGFIDGDLYVFVCDLSYVIVAHATNAKLVGMNQTDLVDVDGKYFYKEFLEVVKTKGEGWVDYKWNNPLTKKLQAKATFVKRVEGKDLFVGCGFYKEKQ